MHRTGSMGEPRTAEARPGSPGQTGRNRDVYAALDLGTNNCRLLIARAAPGGLQILDAFSRIVRLGENLTLTGRLSEVATERTLAALSVCHAKMASRGVTRARLIATEACRAAENGPSFLEEVRLRTGLSVEIVDRETEACLAAEGCAALADEDAECVILFDIGGGSSEIVCLGRSTARGDTIESDITDRIRAWTSLPLGVVSLADRFGGKMVDEAVFGAMVDFVSEKLAPFVEEVRAQPRCGRFHLLGTSGTVTTVAGIHLGLPRYDRRQVDGLWMSDDHVTHAIQRLLGMPFQERVAHGCIGPDRADLVLAGCAILESLRRSFPSRRLRIADRGLREGILIQMMKQDRAWCAPAH